MVLVLITFKIVGLMDVFSISPYTGTSSGFLSVSDFTDDAADILINAFIVHRGIGGNLINGINKS